MIRRDFLSWWFRPAFLQTWGSPAHTLFAGPWVGEFGWELMHWQGFVRKLAPRYRKVIVSCRAGQEALYADFAHEFVLHDVRGTADCNRLLTVDNPDELARILALVPPGADLLRPLGAQPHERQTFIKFGTKQAELATDILFHPRGRGHGADRNWSRANWERLLELLQPLGLRIGCIGLTTATQELQGDFLELRDKPLSQTLDMMASTRLVVGPSSGPMHLASLCATPHLVWTDRKRYARGLTNRTKYENTWNPHHAQAIVLDEWDFQPSPELVAEKITTFLGKTQP
ncbi:MAG: hypothetical protein RL318_97 [Fibrobacterota bacterium]|jgi:ADP-heptose:LPS heptosyltransferase